MFWVSSFRSSRWPLATKSWVYLHVQCRIRKGTKKEQILQAKVETSFWCGNSVMWCRSLEIRSSIQCLRSSGWSCGLWRREVFRLRQRLTTEVKYNWIRSGHGARRWGAVERSVLQPVGVLRCSRFEVGTSLMGSRGRRLHSSGFEAG